MSDVFTFELGTKTYSTKKSDITLQGGLFEVTGQILEAVGCESAEDMQRQAQNAKDGSALSMKLIGALCRFVPPLFWQYLPNDAKNQIGGYEAFLSQLTNELVGKFWQWVNNGAAEAANFTEAPSDETAGAPASASMPFNTPSPIPTAGPLQT